MNKRSVSAALLLLFLAFHISLFSAPARQISIGTGNTELVLLAGKDGRLYQLHYGAASPAGKPRQSASRDDEAYPQYGNGFLHEPALRVTHADGNTSTDLRYVSHTAADDPARAGVTHTRIELADPAYPGFRVALNYRAYAAENIIEQWAEITNNEPGAITLSRYASAALVAKSTAYHLTQIHGAYMREASLAEERLAPGIKILDTKLGVRAHQFRAPNFILSLDGPAREETGRVIGGALAWSGNFQFAFEIDNANRLRALCGINPFASEYILAPGDTFATPALLHTFSTEGRGGMSRNFHRWARAHGIRDGAKPRPVLLNNWEATHCDFDENKLISLFEGAREVGADLFLLDDGWFGNKYPRDNDRAGLGDWEVCRKKLPNGLTHLADAAIARGVAFGIWLEPEMVNPASELFEKHPDWVITQPKRELTYGRNQLILDLTRPEVRAFERSIIDNTLAPNPGITYVKWDCNRYVTQPGSSHLPAGRQSHLLIDYQHHLYDLMRHMAEKYPGVMAMLCSGGSGRVDYGAMRHFHSFWPSDNTDPHQRVFIQWGFSQFFPSNTLSAHVTNMGKKPLKFAIDVALSGAFGIDRDISRWTPAERAQVAAASKLYREHIRPITADGDLYRLASPYDQPRAVLEYVSQDRAAALVFIYNLGEVAYPAIKPLGLDPAKTYRVREINLAPGATSRLKPYAADGATLMRDGFAAPLRRSLESAIIEITAE
ncbi:alpha-galactosidase [Ereboglobus luteus]|uniref:Alpha-galactosidase n=1 Tax=Ereboglobus luteus TaxID=1796921 RepID=A0A2U8E6T4_9BACT|nr:alpha-galactosidase [Ereboglobus luteus]AWI10252.1 alpha-galactosidase [Ereboglobus luteus]